MTAPLVVASETVTVIKKVRGLPWLRFIAVLVLLAWALMHYFINPVLDKIDRFTPWEGILPGSCGTEPEQPASGLDLMASDLGGLIHHITTDESVTAEQVHAAVVSTGARAGKLARIFLDSAHGQPAPTQPAPPAQQVSTCCDNDPGVLEAGLTDSPEVIAARAARAAGFTGTDLVTAVAVAGAESGWDRRAANPDSTARGLWQIMLSLHPVDGAWTDAAVNARAAYDVWQRQGWGAWETWGNGAYRQFLDDARQAIATLNGVQGPQAELPGNPDPRVLPVACSTGTSVAAPAAVEAAVRFALAEVGKPYRWGAAPWDGTGPRPTSYDCSSLIDSAYLAAGIDLPGRQTTRTLILLGSPVSAADVRPGDLVFSSPHHVMLSIGGGRAIAAPYSGAQVREQAYGRPWAVRRLVEAPGTAT